MKLLLVDDDVFLRDMYATKFTEAGYEVTAVDGGMHAMIQLDKGADFDVVLLDMIMPGMTGIELMEKINEQFPNMHARYIVLSNHGESADIDAAKSAGAIGYIIKAESVPSEVVKKVNKLLDNE